MFESHHQKKLYAKLKLLFNFWLFSDALSNAQWLITDFKLSGSDFFHNTMYEFYGNVETIHNDSKPIIRSDFEIFLPIFGCGATKKIGSSSSHHLGF
jgi:hypothetical protein